MKEQSPKKIFIQQRNMFQDVTIPKSNKTFQKVKEDHVHQVVASLTRRIASKKWAEVFALQSTPAMQVAFAAAHSLTLKLSGRASLGEKKAVS